MIREMILFILLLAVLIGLLIFFRRQEGRRLCMRTREALSPSLREEIEKERRENLLKKTKFEEAMQKAQGGDLKPL